MSAVHLLPADDSVRKLFPSARVALCGRLVDPSELPPAMGTPDCEGEHRYCPACVREALRWSAETGAARTSHPGLTT